MLAASSTREIRLIDLNTKKTVATIKGYIFSRQVAFSDDDKLLAGAAHNPSPPMLWNTKDGSLYHQFDNIKDPNGLVAFSGNGTLLSAFSQADRSIHVWDIKAKDRLKKIASDLRQADQGVLSPDGKAAAFCNNKGEVALLNASKAEELARWEAHEGRLGRLLFSADSKLLATTGIEPRQLRLWNARNGEFLRSLFLPLRLDAIRRMEFSPDGSWIGIASDRNLAIFDAKNGQHVYDMVGPRHAPKWIAFSPDGVTVAAPDRGTIYFWKLPKKE